MSYNVFRCDRRFESVGRPSGSGVLFAYRSKYSFDIIGTSHLNIISPLIVRAYLFYYYIHQGLTLRGLLEV